MRKKKLKLSSVELGHVPFQIGRLLLPIESSPSVLMARKLCPLPASNLSSETRNRCRFPWEIPLASFASYKNICISRTWSDDPTKSGPHFLISYGPSNDNFVLNDLGHWIYPSCRFLGSSVCFLTFPRSLVFVYINY